MVALAVGVETCAALLSVESQTLRGCLERGEIKGVRLGDEWRVSLFEMARLLSTSVPELLEVAEDFGLAQAVHEADDDERFAPADGRAVYEQILRDVPA